MVGVSGGIAPHASFFKHDPQNNERFNIRAAGGIGSQLVSDLQS